MSVSFAVLPETRPRVPVFPSVGTMSITLSVVNFSPVFVPIYMIYPFGCLSKVFFNFCFVAMKTRRRVQFSNISIMFCAVFETVFGCCIVFLGVSRWDRF